MSRTGLLTEPTKRVDEEQVCFTEEFFQRSVDIADQASKRTAAHTSSHLTTSDTTPLLYPHTGMVFIYFLILIPLCAIITINIFLAVLVIALNNTEKTEEGEKPKVRTPDTKRYETLDLKM